MYVRLRIFDYILNANFFPVLAMILLLIFVCKNPLFGRRQTRIFAAACSLILLAIIAVSIDTYIDFTDTTGTYHWVRRITSFLNFALSPLIPFLLLKIFSHKKIPFLLLLPLIVNFVMCFVSMFTRVVFYISADNRYARGLLFVLPLIVTIFYVVLLMIGDRQSHTRGKSIERLFLMLSILVLAGAMVMEVYFYARHFIWGTAALIFVMYYLLLGIQARVTDTLTGLYNRAMYYKTLDTLQKRRKCAIAMIDINDFKRVNDTLGHEAGDRVLRLFALLIDSAMTSGAIAYRIGGDEFVCIAKHGNLELLNSCLVKLESKCAEHDMSFAWGSVLYTPSEDIFETVGAADALMYIDKGKSKLVAAERSLIDDTYPMI